MASLSQLMNNGTTVLCAVLGPEDNSLRWFLGEPEMQPGDLGDRLEYQNL